MKTDVKFKFMLISTTAHHIHYTATLRDFTNHVDPISVWPSSCVADTAYIRGNITDVSEPITVSIFKAKWLPNVLCLLQVKRSMEAVSYCQQKMADR